MVYFFKTFKLKNYLVLVFSTVFVFVEVSILLSFFASILVSAGAVVVVVVVVVVFPAAVSGLAGGAVVVSVGAAGGGVVVVVVVVIDAESFLVASPLPLPQEATKRPIERASTLNFTNFINFVFSWLCRFIPEWRKGNPTVSIFFKIDQII
jgi:hypothetical protein